ncbi:MAG: hypothetical protein ACRDWD_02535 [Acidimicrobiia bacterium]
MGSETRLTLMVDEALERFGGRDLVPSAEVLDFLLDLRSEIGSFNDELQKLLDEESQPAPN